jgi:hypothetical protein
MLLRLATTTGWLHAAQPTKAGTPPPSPFGALRPLSSLETKRKYGWVVVGGGWWPLVAGPGPPQREKGKLEEEKSVSSKMQKAAFLVLSAVASAAVLSLNQAAAVSALGSGKLGLLARLGAGAGPDLADGRQLVAVPGVVLTSTNGTVTDAGPLWPAFVLGQPSWATQVRLAYDCVCTCT